jgi:deoxyribodipyrimidine photolyase-related protein
MVASVRHGCIGAAWLHRCGMVASTTSRLVILGGFALRRAWHPARLADWFHRSFVDGRESVIVDDVIGVESVRGPRLRENHDDKQKMTSAKDD